MSDALFKYDGLQDAPAVADVLEAIRDGFARGALSLTQGQQEMVLAPQGLVTVTVEGKRKDDDCKLKLTLRWKERAGDDDARAPLCIRVLDRDDA